MVALKYIQYRDVCVARIHRSWVQTVGVFNFRQFSIFADINMSSLLNTGGLRMFDGQGLKIVKRALIVCGGAQVQKDVGQFTMFCPMQGHIIGHFTTFCPLEGYLKGCSTMFCPLEGHSRGHFTTFCPLEDYVKGHFSMFCPLEGYIKGHFTAFCPLEGYLKGQFTMFCLPEGHP